MKILALETSTETASVALLDGDRLLERSVAGRPGHSETILPEIRLLLAEAGVALDALDAIAFGAGPGPSPACASPVVWPRAWRWGWASR
jgi:tRNA threonylcarbamoyladenosine biosynthesis protein TsaB